MSHFSVRIVRKALSQLTADISDTISDNHQILNQKSKEAAMCEVTLANAKQDTCCSTDSIGTG